MRSLKLLFLLSVLFAPRCVLATIYGRISGVVHDTQHRPIEGARVTIQAAHSALVFTATSDHEGRFSVAFVPLGEYVVTVADTEFASARETVTLASEASPVLHFELSPETVQQTISVEGAADAANVTSATTSSLVGRVDIANAPGAGRTNSMAMITEFVPGAYMTHDLLHLRGGHQVSWLIDGVEIPNTDISSNLGPQIDPKDIDYVEVQRGSYAADVGDRTYGVFDVVPRTGFERNREAEVVLSAGSFLQTNDQISFGDHSQRLAYYASLSGNRSEHGLAPPVSRFFHDAENGAGGFGSMIYNRTPKDQLRVMVQARRDFFQIPYDPDPDSVGNRQFDSSHLRDTQHEGDDLGAFSWLHTVNSSTVFQVSPFLHYNRVAYEPDPIDMPVATTFHRSSMYAGGEASMTTTVARNTLRAGMSSFGLRSGYLFGAVFHDGSGTAPFRVPNDATGGVVGEYVSDSFRATQWLTLIAGLRFTQFHGAFAETAVSPRVGMAVRVPKLNWVFRGFYGRFYQPPPLLTATGPVVQFAQANDTSFQPIHGERDEEHQFGVQIPLRGWVLDADTFRTRIRNFLDHSSIGSSGLYFPVTVDGALVRAWELTVRSPQVKHVGQGHLVYSNQIAEQRGSITGGLICIPVGGPACDGGFTYRPVDHDQRNTLSAGWSAPLPWEMAASASVNYGSGFTNGGFDENGAPLDARYPDAYLPGHTTVDVSLRKSFGAKLSASVTAMNVGNRRVLLDNSVTFGGFHFNDPREVFGEVRYRFRF